MTQSSTLLDIFSEIYRLREMMSEVIKDMNSCSWLYLLSKEKQQDISAENSAKSLTDAVFGYGGDGHTGSFYGYKTFYDLLIPSSQYTDVYSDNSKAVYRPYAGANEMELCLSEVFLNKKDFLMTDDSGVNADFEVSADDNTAESFYGSYGFGSSCDKYDGTSCLAINPVLQYKKIDDFIISDCAASAKRYGLFNSLQEGYKNERVFERNTEKFNFNSVPLIYPEKYNYGRNEYYDLGNAGKMSFSPFETEDKKINITLNNYSGSGNDADEMKIIDSIAQKIIEYAGCGAEGTHL